jgi:hypothetical protein
MGTVPVNGYSGDGLVVGNSDFVISKAPTLMFDPLNDLAAVSDGTETVALLRRGSTPGAPGVVIVHALRRSITAGEAAIVNRGDVRKNVPGGGQHIAADLVWHLPAAELAAAPRLGDLIVDGGRQRWTVLEVKHATLGSRWRCMTRNLSVAYGLDDTISVLKAIDPLGACGPSEPIWRTWRTGVRARVQPIETKITRGEQTASTTTDYRIFVEDDLELDHSCCIRGADGTIYTITGATGAQRIGELQVIEAHITQAYGSVEQ